jgi:hypothetical protein
VRDGADEAVIAPAARNAAGDCGHLLCIIYVGFVTVHAGGCEPGTLAGGGEMSSIE